MASLADKLTIPGLAYYSVWERIIRRIERRQARKL
jgi:hypothetical protein